MARLLILAVAFIATAFTIGYIAETAIARQDRAQGYGVYAQ